MYLFSIVEEFIRLQDCLLVNFYLCYGCLPSFEPYEFLWVNVPLVMQDFAPMYLSRKVLPNGVRLTLKYPPRCWLVRPIGAALPCGSAIARSGYN
jgi:hypothetical protein